MVSEVKKNYTTQLRRAPLYLLDRAAVEYNFGPPTTHAGVLPLTPIRLEGGGAPLLTTHTLRRPPAPLRIARRRWNPPVAPSPRSRRFLRFWCKLKP
jgi:hypothetical protein